MEQQTTTHADKKPSAHESWKMFDRIADTYDPLNRILSMRQDVLWRKKVRKHLPRISQIELLDLATGTGDLLFSLCQNNPDISKAIGVDMSTGMLEVAEKKHGKTSLTQDIQFKQGDAAELPLEDNSFDVVTIAFGIRNVPDFQKAIHEMYRVLKPGGRVIILEFSLPQNKLLRSSYLFYFREFLPRIGGLISGDRQAYTYLNQSVEAFPYGEAFLEVMANAGFEGLQQHPLTFGIATIYRGDKL